MEDNVNKIDFVVPYVDSDDPKWRKLFNQYNCGKNIREGVNAENRFRGQGEFFRYFFRGLEANLSWINNVFLLVQSESQVPYWINRDKVIIVTHDQFIPEEYLPTFNSCTIEMFLGNIPGLSEQFIYANDDIFILGALNPADFFGNKSLLFSTRWSNLNSMYGKQCQNSYKLIFPEAAPAPFLTLNHETRPYRKSHVQSCFEQNKEKILNSISQFREEKNYNCYIYSLFECKNYCVQPVSYKSLYIANKSNLNLNLLNSATIICINDVNTSYNIYHEPFLLAYFSRLFPYPSKYETNFDEHKINKPIIKRYSLDTYENVHTADLNKSSSVDDVFSWMFLKK